MLWSILQKTQPDSAEPFEWLQKLSLGLVDCDCDLNIGLKFTTHHSERKQQRQMFRTWLIKEATACWIL